MHALVTLYFFLFLTVRHAIELGALFFAALGLVSIIIPAMRVRALSSIGGWQQRDSWMALSLMSVFLFKLVSSIWSSSSALALNNAVWHVHFLVWPMVFLGLIYCKPRLHDALLALSISLCATGAWAVLTFFVKLESYYTLVYKINSGVLAELVLVCGSLLMVAVVQPKHSQARWRTALYAAGAVGAVAILYSTQRRTEWIGFFVVAVSVLSWHYRQSLTLFRGVLAALSLICAIAVFFYLRQDRFMLAYHEFTIYFDALGTDRNALNTSVGARLEMYRLGLAAFFDNPVLGMGAGVRPYLLQAYGGLNEAQFGHRHFHSEFLQVLVEGGIVWALLLSTAIFYWFKHAVYLVWGFHPQLSLMAFYLSASYMLAGSISAGLIYGAANGALVIFSALIWASLRQDEQH